MAYLRSIHRTTWSEWFSPTFVFSQSEPTLPRFVHRRNKRCMLVSLKLGADFSRGCALPVIAQPFLATHPPH